MSALGWTVGVFAYWVFGLFVCAAVYRPYMEFYNRHTARSTSHLKQLDMQDTSHVVTLMLCAVAWPAILALLLLLAVGCGLLMFVRWFITHTLERR